MIEFIWFPVFLLLPLPWLVRRLLPSIPTGPSGTLRVPFFSRIADLSGDNIGNAHRSLILLFLMSLIWILLVSAAAQPVLVGQPVPQPVEGRDLMMAIDLSGSMGQEDFSVAGQPTDRLSVVKAVASDFIQRRTGDRVGLVVFGSRAYLQSPLTFDRTVVQSFLNDTVVGLTGQETALGDAIGLAVKRLKDRPVESRVLVLLTDGANNAGVIEPLAAAAIAQEEQVRIYTIGVGADSVVMNSRRGPRLINPSQGLDEATLKSIAELTGGEYFRAKDLQTLAQVYAQIDSLEPVSGDPMLLRPSVALFYVPLSITVLLSLGMAFVLAWPSALPVFNSHFRTLVKG